MFYYVKWLLTIWAISEVGMLTTFYWYAYKNQKPSKVILWLAIFITAALVETCYRLFLSYSVIMIPRSHEFIRNFASIPLILLAVSAHFFRVFSLKREILVIKERE
jgi:hypothetical protein